MIWQETKKDPGKGNLKGPDMKSAVVLKGLGEIELIRHLFVSHAKAAGELLFAGNRKRVTKIDVFHT